MQEVHALSEARILISPTDALVFHPHILRTRPGMKKPGRKPKPENAAARAAKVGCGWAAGGVGARGAGGWRGRGGQGGVRERVGKGGVRA